MTADDALHGDDALRADLERGRHRRGTHEFMSLANLNDGLFAIVLTLLVFDIELADPPLTDARQLLDVVPQLLAFAVSFAVIGRLWLLHHRFIAALGSVRGELIVLNLAKLGLIALMPFVTSLLFVSPHVSGVLVYLGLLALIEVLHITLMVRARARGHYRVVLSGRGFAFVLLDYAAWIAVVLLGMGVAFLWPLGGLVALALAIPVQALLSRFAPREAAVLG